MLKVTKIGYTLTNGTTRKANVLSTSDEDAINFLRRVTKNGITTINDVGMDSEVHAYTDDALEYIKKRTSATTTPTETETPMEAQKVYMCPWCDKSFEKPASIKAHITKSHKKEEEKE